jgi:hypothetical protein
MVKLVELDVSPTVAPSSPAAALRFKAHVELPPGPSETGLHEREVTVTGATGAAVRLMVAPVGDSARGAPSGDAPSALLTPIAAVVAFGVNAIDTTATTPSPIVFALSPEAMQM